MCTRGGRRVIRHVWPRPMPPEPHLIGAKGAKAPFPPGDKTLDLINDGLKIPTNCICLFLLIFELIILNFNK